MLLLVKYLVTKQSDHKLDKKLNKSSVYLVYLAALKGNMYRFSKSDLDYHWSLITYPIHMRSTPYRGYI